MSLFSLVPSFVRSHVPATVSGDAVQNIPAQRPHYHVEENDDAWQLTVILPGVNKSGLDLTVEDGQIRVFARRAWKQPESWTARYRETRDLAYELVLTHDNALNLDAVKAELRDGILVVTLPKAEARKPRKIAVG
ncbi:molecular chaperone (small heat shock protein) [Opitutaceae bacterium TAV1]|nr:molecular chaperone (small heat shock protein) [Opitutaceae bacterium TAV1]